MPKTVRKGRLLSWGLRRETYDLAKAIVATGRVSFISTDEMIRDGIRDIIYRGVDPPSEEALQELIASLDERTRKKRRSGRKP